MAKANVQAGICGFKTVVETRMEGDACQISIESECPSIRRLAAELTEVEPFQEISYRRKMPLTLQAAAKNCPHAACPVPVGIIKAVEVEAGLALPADVSIVISK
jgi:hypothetical protein